MEENLEEKLLFEVFDLVRLTGSEKLTSFKNELDLQSLGTQIESLFDEVHEFAMAVCGERLREIESKKTIRRDSESKRIKLIDNASDKFGDQPETKLRLDLSSAHLTGCDVLSDYLFELMNQGVYSEVGVERRYAFGLTTLYLVLIELHREITISPDFVLRLLNKIDYGLLYSPPFLNKLLARVATRLHDYLVVKLPIGEAYVSLADSNQNADNQAMNDQAMNDQCFSSNRLDRSKEIKRVSCIDLDDFYANYFVKKIPVIIENAIDDWPSVQNWSLDYLLRQAAYRLVPVEIGSRYTDANWTQKVMSVKEFVDTFIVADAKEGDPKGYCAQYELFERIERLSNDFFIPDYCALSNFDGGAGEDEHEGSSGQEDVHINAWFGPANTVSPLHTDPKDNLLAQVFGSKYVRLYSPELPADHYYLYDSHLLNNTSQVDVERVDTARFPNFPSDYQEAILGKGDLLYIPERHWHYVRSLSTSFSISFWWK